jgi:hypothetical protein
MVARSGPPSVHALGLAGTAAMLLSAAAVLPLGVFECPLRAATHIAWTVLRVCGLPYAPRLSPLTPAVRAAAVFAIALNWAYVALS